MAKVIGHHLAWGSGVGGMNSCGRRDGMNHAGAWCVSLKKLPVWVFWESLSFVTIDVTIFIYIYKYFLDAVFSLFSPNKHQKVIKCNLLNNILVNRGGCAVLT